MSGNPEGEPVIIHHGGPGGFSPYSLSTLFDPKRYALVFIDQPGCGQSEPNTAKDILGALANNDTNRIVSAVELVRKDLGIEQFHSFGGSWGSTVALTHATRHPDAVFSLTVRGIFFGTKAEVDFCQGNQNPNVGAAKRFPDVWQDFMQVPREAVMLGILESADLRDNVVAYSKIFALDTTNNEEGLAFQRKALLAWSRFEDDSSFLVPPASGPMTKDEMDQSIRMALLECSFFKQLNREEFAPGIQENLRTIANTKIPVFIVHGEHDMVCPVSSAYRLKDGLDNLDGKVAGFQINNAGHAAMCENNYRALTKVVSNLPPMPGYLANVSNDKTARNVPPSFTM